VGDFRPNNFNNNNKKSSPLLTFLPLLISRYSLSLSLSLDLIIGGSVNYLEISMFEWR
jgi:hypothetical protein